MFKTRKCRQYVRLVSLMFVPFAILGCATTTRNTTSVVDYLYPDSNKVETPSVPVLKPPLRVGIAFVPGVSPTHSSASTRVFLRSRGQFELTEKKKLDLMREVANHFKKYPVVKDIEIIPSAYLTPRGSFANLDQIKTMYGITVIALLSYDQTQFTDEGSLTLAYATIVGAFVVQGEKNDTHTMLDAVIYDIPSRKMLFRAPGTSLVKGSATPINLSEQLRVDSEAGFNLAAREMISNLDLQLEAFRERAKEQPSEYKIQPTSQYRGGGALDALAMVLFAGLGGGFLWLRRGA